MTLREYILRRHRRVAREFWDEERSARYIAAELQLETRDRWHSNVDTCNEAVEECIRREGKRRRK